MHLPRKCLIYKRLKTKLYTFQRVQWMKFSVENLRKRYRIKIHNFLTSTPGRVAKSVTCLTTGTCLTADTGVASSIPAQSHSFMEIDHINNFYGHSPPFRRFI